MAETARIRQVDGKPAQPMAWELLSLALPPACTHLYVRKNKSDGAKNVKDLPIHL
jgi:hypothetical protein